jgi:ferredoxin, 2Fe-2S
MKATWSLPDGIKTTAEVKEGQSLMEAAVAIGIANIIGECGGNLSCATCHVYVSDEFAERTGKPGDFEDAMLDAAEAPRLLSSRLSCQIRMSPDLDGIVLTVPAP